MVQEYLSIQSIQTLVLIGSLLFIRYFIAKTIRRLNVRFHLDAARVRAIRRATNFFLVLVGGVFLAGIWGVNKNELLFFLSSVLTVLGIAFFAQWSILSNITAGIIVFFSHPMKTGDSIRIYDKDYDLRGELVDISIFFMHVRTSEGRVITIPNNVVLQKMIEVL